MARGRPSRATVYARLSMAVDDLARLGGLPAPLESDDVWADIWHQDAHHSTAIEGNTLALREVQDLLIDGRAVGAKPLREYTEVKGYGDAAKWVYQQALEPDGWTDGELVTMQELRRIHFMAMTPVWDVDPPGEAGPEETPGNFRRHDIRAFHRGMKPPPWTDVQALMQGWVDEAAATGRRLSLDPSSASPVEELARLHNGFERIHPFLDGNGRAGRLVLNLMLVRLGYPPAVIVKQQRERYLQALRRADAGDVGPLGELIARAVYDNLLRFIVPNIAGPARLVPLASLAGPEFSVAALRQAAQRGRLEAVQGTDGVWLSSRHAVRAYQQSKHRRQRGSASAS